MAIVTFPMLHTEIKIIPNPNFVNFIDCFITKQINNKFICNEIEILYNEGFTPINPLETISWTNSTVTKEAHKQFDCDENGFADISEIVNEFRKLDKQMKAQYDFCDSIQKSINVQE